MRKASRVWDRKGDVKVAKKEGFARKLWER